MNLTSTRQVILLTMMSVSRDRTFLQRKKASQSARCISGTLRARSVRPFMLESLFAAAAGKRFGACVSSLLLQCLWQACAVVRHRVFWTLEFDCDSSSSTGGYSRGCSTSEIVFPLKPRQTFQHVSRTTRLAPIFL